MEYNTIYLNSARNCLRYIIKAYNISEIHMPYYICPAIRNAAFKESCRIHFYNIDRNFQPLKIFKEDDYILYPDYWGICSNTAEELSKKYKNLIIDNAHSFFSKPLGIASFNSLRKFFPKIRNGAELYTAKTIELYLETDNYSYPDKNLSYEEICKNEKIIEQAQIKLMSVSTKKIFSNYNIEKLKQQRLESFFYFHNMLGQSNQIHIELKTGDIPFCYPFLANSEETAQKTVKNLENQNYIIYRYWNNMPDNFEEKILYKRLVPIPLIKCNN